MNNMKNTLIQYIVTIIVVIAVVELTNFAFNLMNQPDTYVFYLGLLIILSEGFAGGWLVMRTLKNIFSPKEDNSEKKDTD
jgi:ABC-type nickel/cobalt efflux system permease component RcnA